MNYFSQTVLMLPVAMALAAVPLAGATTIDFEAQAASQGGSLTGIPDSPLTIGIATFTGGELRDAEIGLLADQTGVYASEGIFGSGETNPLVITFSAPVSGFSVYVANADDAENYTVSDNLGDSVTMLLLSVSTSGAATFTLPGNGITTVDITSANSDSWNFAIDDVSFTEIVSTPEPASFAMLGAGLLLFAGARRCKLL
jgi:hypothetical protein